jgi:hypothetical protein
MQVHSASLDCRCSSRQPKFTSASAHQACSSPCWLPGTANGGHSLLAKPLQVGLHGSVLEVRCSLSRLPRQLDAWLGSRGQRG